MRGSVTLRHVIVVTPTEVIPDGFVRVSDGLVQGLGPEPAPQGPDDINARGLIAAPGLVDVHIHGAGGYDVMDLSTRSIVGMAEFLACRGVTSFIPTTVSLELEDMIRACAAVRGALTSRGSRVLGIHFEGPYISKARAGAHDPNVIRDPSADEVNRLLAECGDVMREVTMAPELPGAIEAIRQLSSRGVVVQVGHSDATFAQVQEAFRAGATKVTHLFDAMRPFHHREPGVVGAALASRAYVEIIGDMVHVSPEAFTLAYEVVGPRRLALVSDATPAAGLPEGRYSFWGLSVESRGGAAWISGKGVLAGSASTLDVDMANVYRLGISAPEAIQMATMTPALSASALARDAVGALAPGAAGDVVLLDKDLRPRATFLRGVQVCGKL